TPEHIRAIATAVRDCKPRSEPNEHYAQLETLQLSGLEPLNITPDFGFVVIGERTNITGSPRFSKLILSDDFDGALAVARQQVQGGANILDINMDEAMIDSEAAMTRFLNLIASEPEIARIAITRSISSKRRAGSKRISRARGSAAASATFRFPFAATMRCAKRCTPRFCFMPSAPDSTWRS